MEETTNPTEAIETPAATEGVGEPQAVETSALPEEGAEEGEGDQQPPAIETEEIELDGKKYAVPKELKDKFLMHADYTRKTQELAELRRAAEAERARYQQANAEHVKALATIQSIDQQLAQYEQINWAQLSDQDPVQAQKLWMQFSQLKDARQQVVGQLQQMEQQRAFESQQEHAKRLEEGEAILKRDIPNWGPDLAKQITTFAVKEFGLQPQELAQIVDPRHVKILHAAMVGAQLAKKQTAAPQPSEPVKPVPKVGGNAPARKDMNSLSVEDWMRARNDQLRKSKGR